MKQAFQDVLDFHDRFGQVVGSTPSAPEGMTVDLRLSLMREEFGELNAAISRGDLAGIADGAVDLMYVVLGTLASYGIDPTPVWEAVHAANMAKVGGGLRADGKVTKPRGWRAPDVAAILAAQSEIRNPRLKSER